jgi:hypothetical protein
MLHKLRIALAATIVALAAVTAVDSASEAQAFWDPLWAPAAVMSAGAATALAPASTFLGQFWRMTNGTPVPAGLP